MKAYKKFLSFSLLLMSVLVCATACFGSVATEADLKTFLDRKEIVFEEISIQMGEANWNVYSEEGEADQDKPKSRFYELFGDRELNRIVDEWFEKREIIRDPVLKRRIEVWKKVLTGARVDMDENIYRLENKLEAWLADPKEANDRPGDDELDAEILKLMRWRNAKAQDLGYENYAEMILDITGLGAGWFRDFSAQVDSATKAPCLKVVAEIQADKENGEFTKLDFRRLVGAYYRIARDNSHPEDQRYSLMRETVENIGFRYDAMPIRFVQKQIPFRGNGLAIRIPDDFRVVILPGSAISTWMHELGHGLQALFTETGYPILKGYEWCIGNVSTAFAEGMAETAARFVLQPAWLKEYAGFSKYDIRKRDREIRKHIPFYIRMWMNRFMFEIALYEGLDQDIEALRDRLDAHYLFVENPDNSGIRLSDSIMLVSYPVYLHNYLIANFISWQVHETLEKKFGGDYVFNKKVATFLKEKLYRNGELLSWQERIEMATGKELDIKGYLKSFGMSIQ